MSGFNLNPDPNKFRLKPGIVVEVPLVTPIDLVVTSRGLGTSVAVLRLVVNHAMTLTLTNSARFYTNLLGTTGESTTKDLVAGINLTYVRCSSGTANLSIPHPEYVTMFGQAISISGGYPGWYNSSPAGASANCPSLNVSPLVDDDFPGLLQMTVFDTALTPYSITAEHLPRSLQYFIKMSGTVVGLASDLPPGLIWLNASGNLSGDVNGLPSSLIKLSVGNGNTLSGNISGLPPLLDYLSLAASNTVSGNVSSLPSSLLYINIAGSNTINGNISGIPVSITQLSIFGLNTITGNVSGLANTLQRFTVWGNNTISGNIIDLPTDLVVFNVTGNNIISGSLDDIPVNCASVSISGYNTVGGGFTGLSSSCSELYLYGYNVVDGDIADLPAALQTVAITGLNIVHGDLANLTANPYQFQVYGNNVITGDISNIPTATYYFLLLGANTVYGDIGTIPLYARDIRIGGQNTISDYTGRTWLAAGYGLEITPVGAGGLSSVEVDALLIDIDAGCSFSSYPRVIALDGANAAPTAASLVARNSLIAKGVSLSF
jgi:hypothetical protein